MPPVMHANANARPAVPAVSLGPAHTTPCFWPCHCISASVHDGAAACRLATGHCQRRRRCMGSDDVCACIFQRLSICHGICVCAYAQGIRPGAPAGGLLHAPGHQPFPFATPPGCRKLATISTKSHRRSTHSPLILPHPSPHLTFCHSLTLPSASVLIHPPPIAPTN